MKSIKRNVKALRRVGFGIDIANVLLGVAIIVFCVFIFIDVEGNVKLFPILFLCAFIMNFLLGIKSKFREENKRAIMQFVFSAFLFIICLIGFLGLWR